MEYRDFPDPEFKPDGIRTVRDPKVIEYFEDENFSIILNVLREKPMTVKELTKRYNEYVTERGTSKRLPQERILERLRTDKTMYRYIKELTKAKLIAPAGQRMVIGKTATEVLYSRSAKIFYVSQEALDWWLGDEGRRTVVAVGGLLGIALNKPSPPTECLTQLISRILGDNEEKMFKLFEEKQEEVTKFIYTLEGRETDRAIYIMNIILALINVEKYKKELDECLGI
ncbi:MAG: hypothetical protein GOP50_10335 [Candidatus Heimdallarchaeota archaeon]|nr:hypothetical protein [Candidatus Heimdallarchaeota archaeon]